jgi:hypothetical protein
MKMLLHMNCQRKYDQKQTRVTQDMLYGVTFSNPVGTVPLGPEGNAYGKRIFSKQWFMCQYERSWGIYDDLILLSRGYSF